MKRKLNKYLKNNELLRTEERYLILEIIKELPEQFSTRDVKLKIPNGYSICSGTVYLTLDLFVKAKLIKLVSTVEPKKYYTLIK